mgnify:CR=1 FL=1
MKYSDKNGEGLIVHAYNRGNNKERIFFDEQDYKAFLFRMALSLGFTPEELNNIDILRMLYSRIRIESGKKNQFKIHSFCLMPNHFHLIIEQCGKTSISKFISRLCISYATYINKKYRRVGHLFQDRYKSNPISSDEQLMWTSAYIHMNPVKDHIVKSPEKYRWSSYNDYVGTREIKIVTNDLITELFGDKDAFIKETLNYFSKDDYMSRTRLDM